MGDFKHDKNEKVGSQPRNIKLRSKELIYESKRSAEADDGIFLTKESRCLLVQNAEEKVLSGAPGSESMKHYVHAHETNSFACFKLRFKHFLECCILPPLLTPAMSSLVVKNDDGRESSFSLLLVHVRSPGNTSVKFVEHVHGYYPEVLAYKLKGPLDRVEWDDFGNQGTLHVPQGRADFELAKKRDFCHFPLLVNDLLMGNTLGIKDPTDNNAKILSWADNKENGTLSFSLFNFSAYFKEEKLLHVHEDLLLTMLDQKYESFFLHGLPVSFIGVINHVAVSKAPKSMSECQGLRVTSQGSHGLSPYNTRWSNFSNKRDFCLFPGFNQCKGYPPDNNVKLFHWQEKADFLVSLSANFKDMRILWTRCLMMVLGSICTCLKFFTFLAAHGIRERASLRCTRFSSLQRVLLDHWSRF